LTLENTSMIEGKRFCLDTSGLSNPLENMPEDIVMYQHIWRHVKSHIENGVFAVNEEIYQELCRLPGTTGDCLQNNKSRLVLELGENWDWERYLEIVEEMRNRHHGKISEYNGNRKGTVGLNDVSIVALAKCLSLPLISMESRSYQPSENKVRIPALCDLEVVEHLTFNDYLLRQ
jgi:Domain of unknown function (DUF4411)